MKSTSIAAYERPARVASYDADMDIMHPNRHKMVSIALEILPFDSAAAITALDLGTGTGFFTAKFLERFPQASVISVDGSNSMMDLARTRLGSLVAKVDFRIGDFRQLQSLIPESSHGEVVFSSYALHHLNRSEKRAVMSQALRFLKPGGWLINADIVTSETRVIDERLQQLRIEGIVRRGSADPRFKDATSVRQFLDQLETTDGDQPFTLAEDLSAFREAGFADSAIFWSEYREAVIAGRK
ncbi:MAG TPA: methyltransferase domain-containing protein [Terriglobia bacterium]|jgi:ubiquinone/menaquinone biosynthesis C-methylase UbiE|nr:methyltransferase domain-containing protein [Terriglobia bacterium]